jgi:hypothetical protein
MALTKAEIMRRYRSTPNGLTRSQAAQRKYNGSEKGKAALQRYFQSDKCRETKRKYNAKSFTKFKKALTARIECLRHTSPEFREARIQEILNWAGASHSYWVESEIQNV